MCHHLLLPRQALPYLTLWLEPEAIHARRSRTVTRRCEAATFVPLDDVVATPLRLELSCFSDHTAALIYAGFTFGGAAGAVRRTTAVSSSAAAGGA